MVMKTLKALRRRNPADRKVILGVIAMDKKTRAKPMTHILDRLRATGEFIVVIFGEKVRLSRLHRFDRS